MNGGEIEVGKCDICRQEDKQLSRKYYRYNIKCECCSPWHFELVSYCSDCKPVEPKETRVTYQTSKLTKIED